MLGSRGRCLTQHSVLLLRDIGPTGATQIEHRGGIRRGHWLREVSRDEPPQVFGEGNTELGGALAGPPLQLRVEGNLGSEHHDITIIMVPVASPQARLLAAGPGGGHVHLPVSRLRMLFMLLKPRIA